MNRARALAITLAATTILGLGACGGAADGGSATCPNGKIRFGVEPYEDPKKLTAAYEAVGKSLEKQLGCPVEVTVVEDYSAEVLAMQNGQLELGQFGPLGFVFAHQRLKAEPLVSFGTAEGELSTYRADIWVPKSSDVKTVADLRSKSLALGGVGSTSGDALPRFALAEAGLDEKTDLKIDYAGGHPEAMLALTNGKVDAAEINTQQLAVAKAEGQFDPSKFRQVWASDDIPNDPITVNPKLSPEFKKAVRKALRDMPAKDIQEVGKLLDVSPAGKMLPVEVETYQPMFELAKTLKLTEEDA